VTLNYFKSFDLKGHCDRIETDGRETGRKVEKHFSARAQEEDIGDDTWTI
jgi:hypothetical protein